MLVAASSQAKAKELNDRLFSLKNLLLIGFVVQIGYYGIPSLPMILVAALLTLLVVLRPLVYFSLLVLFGLRARTASLVGVSLFNYSEFGLIVASYAVSAGLLESEWIVTLALAMAMSFIVATPVNNNAHTLFRRYRSYLTSFEREKRLPEETIGTLGDANVVVLGMGRVGRGAYEALTEAGYNNVVGIEENRYVTQDLNDRGFACVHGDASDRDFWERTQLADRDLLLLSLSNRHENLAVVELARELGFKNTLAVATRFPGMKKRNTKRWAVWLTISMMMLDATLPCIVWSNCRRRAKAV